MRSETFGAEWFGPVLGTMVLSLESWILSQVGVFPGVSFEVGKVIYLLDIAFLVLVTSLWALHMKHHNDFLSVNRVSFTAFLGVLGYLVGFFYITYLTPPSSSRFLFLALFVLSLGETMGVNLLLWYRIFSGEIDSSEVTYSFLIPSIAISASSILSTPLLPPLSDWFNGSPVQGFLYASILVTTGITVFQFLFLGSLAIVNAVRKGEFTTYLIPVGASSIVLINVIIQPSLGFLDFPKGVAYPVSLMLWGFEVWNLSLGFIIALRKFRGMRPNMGVWTFVFPLGISSFADFLLYTYTGIALFYWTIFVLVTAVVVLYVYAWRNLLAVLRTTVG